MLCRSVSAQAAGKGFGKEPPAPNTNAGEPPASRPPGAAAQGNSKSGRKTGASKDDQVWGQACCACLAVRQMVLAGG